MKNTLETRLGMFIALAMVAAFFILHIIGGGDFLKPGYHLRARFASIQELKVGDAVKLAGFPVGRVEKMTLAPGEGKVELLLRLNKDTPIRTDSKASIKFAGLMGQNYVSVDFGSPGSPVLLENQLITTTEAPDLSALMAKLDTAATGVQNLTQSFTGDKIDNLLGPFTDFLKQNSPRLSAILANAQSVSTQVAQGKGTVGRLIFEEGLYTNANAAVTNMQDVAADIKQTIAKANGIVDQINAGKGTVGKLLTDEALYRESTDSMKHLNEILQKINHGQGSVGKLVNDQDFYKNAQLSLQKLDKATESLEDTGPLSLLGSVISTLL